MLNRDSSELQQINWTLEQRVSIQLSSGRRATQTGPSCAQTLGSASCCAWIQILAMLLVGESAVNQHSTTRPHAAHVRRLFYLHTSVHVAAALITPLPPTPLMAAAPQSDSHLTLCTNNIAELVVGLNCALLPNQSCWSFCSC